MSNKNKAKNIATAVVCIVLVICATIAIFLSRYDWHVDNVLGGFAPVGHEASADGSISEVKKPRDWTYFDDAVMVGDSITYGMGSYGYLDFDHVFAKIGLHQGTALTSKIVYKSKTDNYTIFEALSMAKPGKIYVTLGINAIYSYTSDWFYDNYRALLNKIKKASPDSKIIIQSIYPVTQNWALNNNKPNCNNAVAYANKKLLEIAKEYKIPFLFTYESLCDENGFLIPEYSSDGLHLSRKGYETVFNYILTHPVKSSGKFTKIGAIKPPYIYRPNSSEVQLPNLESSSVESSSTSDIVSSIQSDLTSNSAAESNSLESTSSNDTQSSVTSSSEAANTNPSVSSAVSSPSVSSEAAPISPTTSSTATASSLVPAH